MRQATVLLVDQDRDSVNIYSLMLRHHGFAVLLATEPEQALKMVTDSRPDVIVSALSRPRKDKVDFIEGLYRDGGMAVPPLIQLDSVRCEGAISGGSPVTRLLMPCEPSRLLREVRRVLSGPAGLAH